MSQIVDFNQVREQKLEEKRRKTERILFQQLFTVYIVSNDENLLPIELIDVSEEGCSFQLPHHKKAIEHANDVPIRFYMSRDTFLELRVKVINSRPFIDAKGRFVRYGCQVDTSTQAYPAYQQFVKFLKLYSELARKDLGGSSLFYL